MKIRENQNVGLEPPHSVVSPALDGCQHRRHGRAKPEYPLHQNPRPISSGMVGSVCQRLPPAQGLRARTIRNLNRDFPFGFLPKTSLSLLSNLLAVPQVCKSFSPPPFVFSEAKRALRCDLCLFRHSSIQCESNSSTAAFIFVRVLSLFLHPNAAAGNLSCPIWRRPAPECRRI